MFVYFRRGKTKIQPLRKNKTFDLCKPGDNASKMQGVTWSERERGDYSDEKGQ